MGLGKRFSLIFRAKASKALDRAEDPREVLDYSYEKQLDLLQKVRRGVAEVATSRKRLELQGEKLKASNDKLEKQAAQALQAGREDLAREALTRKAAIQQQFESLRVQHEQLNTQEQNLVTTSRRLEAKIEAFRTRKETVKANYTAAQASAQIGEAFSGLSEEMGDVGLAMQRAEDKTEQMQARAGALDELIASGALDDASAPSDPIQAELDRVAATTGIDAELERMKQSIGSGDTPAALPAGSSDMRLGLETKSTTPETTR